MADNMVKLIGLSHHRKKMYFTKKKSWENTYANPFRVLSVPQEIIKTIHPHQQSYLIPKINSSVSCHTTSPNKLPKNLALSKSPKMQHTRFYSPTEFQNLQNYIVLYKLIYSLVKPLALQTNFSDYYIIAM